MLLWDIKRENYLILLDIRLVKKEEMRLLRVSAKGKERIAENNSKKNWEEKIS